MNNPYAVHHGHLQVEGDHVRVRATAPPTDSSWQPDWAVPPGEVLLEALRVRGMTQTELAKRMARPAQAISQIVTAKKAITPATAIQLERVLDVPARFWLVLEADYRLHLARKAASP